MLSQQLQKINQQKIKWMESIKSIYVFLHFRLMAIEKLSIGADTESILDSELRLMQQDIYSFEALTFENLQTIRLGLENCAQDYQYLLCEFQRD